MAGDQGSVSGSDSTKRQASEVSKAQRMAKDAEKALDLERRHNMKKELKRVAQERKEQKARERELHAVRKAQERAAREASREEKRRKKVEIREQREKFAKEQKEAALRRAAELVTSNRVPIEITRGAAAAKAGKSLIRRERLIDMITDLEIDFEMTSCKPCTSSYHASIISSKGST